MKVKGDKYTGEYVKTGHEEVTDEERKLLDSINKEYPTEQEEWDAMKGRIKHMPGGKMSETNIGTASSGHWGHESIPGHRGGSAPGKGTISIDDMKSSKSIEKEILKKFDVKSGFDVKHTEEIKTILTSYYKIAPKAIDRIGAMGERMTTLERGLEENREVMIQRAIKNGIPPDVAREDINDRITAALLGAVQDGGRTPASTLVGQNGKFYIGFNPNIQDEYGVERKAMDRDVRIGWHPPGANSVKGVVDHEIGHVLDYHFEFSNDPVIEEMSESLTIGNVRGGLAEYATVNPKEFFATVWCEYKNNPQPREIAMKFGSRMEQIMREKS
jgi:hypothetical protein